MPRMALILRCFIPKPQPPSCFGQLSGALGMQGTGQECFDLHRLDVELVGRVTTS